MAATIAPASLKSLLEGKTPFALIDVREAGEYNSSHIPGSSLIARRQLEFAVPQAVPFKGTPLVVCDDDGRRAALAARTLERLGYRQVSVLDGGINRWVTDGMPTEWGMNEITSPYGSWKSPITADLVAGGEIGLEQLRMDGESTYWIERRPQEGGR